MHHSLQWDSGLLWDPPLLSGNHKWAWQCPQGTSRAGAGVGSRLLVLAGWGIVVQGLALLGWAGRLTGVYWVHVCSGVSHKSHCPFCAQIFYPCLWKPLPVSPQTNPFTCPCLNSRCYQLCLCKCLKYKQWVSTIYSRHLTEKKQRRGYVRQSSSFNAQLNERLQKALSTRVCKGAIKAENIVLL